MKLTDVSKTALDTLRSHVLESQRNNPIINNPMAAYCLGSIRVFQYNKGYAILVI